MDLKLKVEKVETTSRGGKSIQFSGAWSGSALYTGDSLPSEVKEGAEVECEIKEVKKKSGDGVWTAVNFPKYEQKQAPQQKTAWQGGRQEDVELKIVSFSMSYAKDLFVNTPESTLKGMFDTADQIAEHMMLMYKKLKG